MIRHFIRHSLPVLIALSVSFTAQGVTLRFDPANPAIGPFPSDAATVSDPLQKTSRRVNMPLPDCASQPDTCQEITLLNRLDGFSLLPRIRLSFSGPINPDSLRQGVYFVALDNLTNEEYGLQQTGQFIPINEVVYDPVTYTAFAKPDAMLDQHRRFGIVITDAVSEFNGASVTPDPAMQTCLTGTPGFSNIYCQDLARMVNEQMPRFGGRRIVGASIFTTMSASKWLETVRAGLMFVSPQFQPAAGKSIFRVGDLASLKLRLQTKAGASDLSDQTFPASILSGVGRLAFGTFQSPNYLDRANIIPDTPVGPPAVPLSTIAFHIYLPAAAPPPNGFPVVIFGHGLGDHSFGGPSVVASILNQAGFAVLAINAFGHGSGPLSRIALIDKIGNTAEILTGGRGLDITGDGNIDSFEGCILFGILGTRDCLRQTTVDLMQLVHLVQTGPLDFGSEGTISLDPSRIYYAGQSLGGIYGTILTAIEPNIRAAALNSAGGSIAEINRLSPALRLASIVNFGTRNPPLLNKGFSFDPDYPLRYEPAHVISIPGAVPIQEFYERAEWYGMSGDAIAYAPHLKSSTLPGVPIKSVLWQMPRGDQTVPNPAGTNLIRAANMRESTRIYRHDIARALIPQLPANPHTFLTDSSPAPALLIALAAQLQIAGFLASDGAVIPDVNPNLSSVFPQPLFETPAFLPEDPAFQQ
jgi:pimeloyl-ACP methyl ester carboxylesterase